MHKFGHKIRVALVATTLFALACLPALVSAQTLDLGGRIIFDPAEKVVPPNQINSIAGSFSLSAQPSTDLTVAIEGGKLRDKDLNIIPGSTVTVTPSNLVVKKSDWQKKQSFTVKITGNKGDKDTATISATGSTTDRKLYTSNFFSIYLTNDDIQISSSVIFSPTTIKWEKNGKTSVKATLKDKPELNETVKIKLTYDKDFGPIKSLDKSELVFTDKDYNKPQTINATFSEKVSVADINTLPFFGFNADGTSKKYKYSGFFNIDVPKDQLTIAPKDGDTGPAGFGSPLSALIAEESGFVYQAWRVTRSVINILLIIALFAISFSNITRINIDTYTIKKALPNLIIGIILANASLYIIRFMSDITTVVTYFFVNQVGSTTFADFVGDTAELFGKNAILTIGWGLGPLAFLLILIFALITIVGLLWLSFLLYFRLVSIYLLTILSPLAFVSYGIPGFDKYFKQWWQQFTKWLFIVPAMSAVFWLMLVIGNAGGNNQSIARLLIMYVLFFTALTLPSKMGGAVIDKASKAFMKYSGANAAMNASKEFAQQKGQQIGYRLPGVARYQAWRDLQKENAKKDIEQLKKRGRNKVLDGKTGRNYEKLKLLDKEISMNEEAILARKEVEAGNLKGGRGFRKDESISERLIRAEYEKKLEEEKKNYNDGQEKLEFVNSDDEEIKVLLKKVFKSTIDQEVVSKEVGRAENQQKGNIATGYLQPLQAAANYGQLRSELEGLDTNDPEFATKKAAIDKAMNDIRTSFAALQQREGNEEYRAFKDLDDFMLAYDPSENDKTNNKEKVDEYKQKFGTKIREWQGRQRQTSKMFNEGIAGQIETDVKEQTVAQLERELKAYFGKELKGNDLLNGSEMQQLFMKGDTAALSAAGIEDKDIRAGRVIMEKYKQLMRSTNDIRNRDALKSFVDAHNEVMAGTGHEFNQELLDAASSDTQQDRRAAAGHIAQESGIMSGQPHYSTQNGKPLKPKEFKRKNKKQRVNIPPPPTPPERRAGFRGDPDFDQRQAEYERLKNEYDQKYGGQTNQQGSNDDDDEENGENT